MPSWAWNRLRSWGDVVPKRSQTASAVRKGGKAVAGMVEARKMWTRGAGRSEKPPAYATEMDAMGSDVEHTEVPRQAPRWRWR